MMTGPVRLLQGLVYQFTRIPKRTIRGATIAWMLFALVAFWLPRTAWMVSLLVRLKTSIDGTMWPAPNPIGRSRWKSKFWNVGRLFSPIGSSSSVGVPPPFGSAVGTMMPTSFG